jgi:predicted RNase H-like nuclease
MWVAGVDGCPAGWLVVFRSINGESPRARIVDDITQVLSAPERPKRIAIDIPIGLPAVSEPGGRSADREARKKLTGRKSSIFPAPSRRVLDARSFEEARRIEQQNSYPSKKLAKQVFHLLDKIREVDSIAPIQLGVMFECHPELSFWAMNGKKEMPHPKRAPQGFEERCRLLMRNRYGETFLSEFVGKHKQHSRDDLLDACAAAWTAERILKKTAIRFPELSIVDDHGIEMAIWA